MNCQIDQVRKHLESASAPGHWLGPLANTSPLPHQKKGIPCLPSNTLWPLPMVSEATEVLPSFLSHDANETETPDGTLSCVLRGTPTTNYTFSFTLHSSSSKTRIWLLTRRGARGRASTKCHLLQEPERTAWWSAQGMHHHPQMKF